MCGYIFNPIVVLDREFLEDYARATSLKGLARKKAIAELAAFNCIAACGDGVYLAFQFPGTEPLSIDAQGCAVTFIEGSVLFDVSMTEHAIRRSLPAGMIPDPASAEGWIAVDDVLELSESEMMTYLDQMRQSNL